MHTLKVFAKIALILIIAPLISQCSKSDADSKGSVSPFASPNIDVTAFSGKCLNLQKVFDQINSGAFSFPALTYTRDYQITAGNASADRERTLFARSLEFKHLTLNHWSEFRGLKQSGCDTVTIPISGNIVATYKITESTTRALHLEFVPFEEPMIPGRPQGKRFVDAMKKFALTTGISVELVGNRQLIINSTYELAPYVCHAGEKLSATDSQVVIWDTSEKSLPTSAQLAPSYFNKMSSLFPDFFSNPNPVVADREDMAATPNFVEVTDALIGQFNASAPMAESACVF